MWTSKTYRRVSHHYPNNIVQARAGIFVSTIDAKITPVHANETVRREKSPFSSVVYVVSPTEINLNVILIYSTCSACLCKPDVAGTMMMVYFNVIISQGELTPRLLRLHLYFFPADRLKGGFARI